MAQVQIYNNGLGEFFLPPPRDLPQHAREGLRGKLRIPAGGSVRIEESLWLQIALHGTVRPYVARGVLATRPLRVERRRPASAPSDEDVRRALERGGTPLDLYVGLVPDPALQHLADGTGPRVAVASDLDAVARANAELARANEKQAERLAALEAELADARAALLAREAEVAQEGANAADADTPEGDGAEGLDEGEAGGRRRSRRR